MPVIAQSPLKSSAPLKTMESSSTSVLLAHPTENAEQWGFTINGIAISEALPTLSNPKGGMRFDKQPALGYHFPQLVAQGYELASFQFELAAYDTAGISEINRVIESVLPTVADVTIKKQKLTVSTIIHTPINMRGMRAFVVQDCSPFVYADPNDPDVIKWNATFILFSPPKQMGLGNFGQPNKGLETWSVPNTEPTNYSPSAGAPGSIMATTPFVGG